MTPTLTYSHSNLTGRRVADAPRYWSIANALRRQVLPREPDQPLEVEDLTALFPRVLVNGQAIDIAWDLQHPVHDAGGHPVYGVCEVEPEIDGTANVCVNGPLLRHRPDVMLSTAAHELGHVVFDIAKALSTRGPAFRHYRSHEAADNALRDPAALSFSEWRANEFMGALLAPAIPVHKRLLHHARSERLHTMRGTSAGHPAWPVLARDNDPEAVAGVTDVLAQEFGVSPRFMSVRLALYRLIARNSRMGDRA